MQHEFTLIVRLQATEYRGSHALRQKSADIHSNIWTNLGNLDVNSDL